MGYPGFNVRETGESSIVQLTAADDILTIQGAPSQTGDFLVMENNSGTDLALFDSNGDLVHYKTSQSAFGRTQLAIINTAPASAGLVKGDMWAAKSTTDTYRLAMCSSTATGAVKYSLRFNVSTIGNDEINMVAGGIVNAAAKGTVGQTSFARLRLPILNTAPASAGLTKGELFLAYGSTTDIYRLALCVSTATGACKYGARITRNTFGTLSS